MKKSELQQIIREEILKETNYNLVIDNLKPSDLNKLDDKTREFVQNILKIGFKHRQIGIYGMYANVHITLPSAIRVDGLKQLTGFMPAGSSLSTGNSFRSGLTIRLPWNFG
jgi:hypothetical protein